MTTTMDKQDQFTNTELYMYKLNIEIKYIM